MLPQTNGNLLLIDRARPGDDWDHDDQWVNRWTGTIPAYTRERRIRVRTGQGDEFATERTIIVETDKLQAAGMVIEGERLSFTFSGEAHTGVVQIVERRESGDVAIAAAGVETTRVTLDAVQPVAGEDP